MQIAEIPTDYFPEIMCLEILNWPNTDKGDI